jgi:hypothetical protein
MQYACRFSRCSEGDEEEIALAEGPLPSTPPADDSAMGHPGMVSVVPLVHSSGDSPQAMETDAGQQGLASTSELAGADVRLVVSLPTRRADVLDVQLVFSTQHEAGQHADPRAEPSLAEGPQNEQLHQQWPQQQQSEQQLQQQPQEQEQEQEQQRLQQDVAQPQPSPPPLQVLVQAQDQQHASAFDRDAQLAGVAAEGPNARSPAAADAPNEPATGAQHEGAGNRAQEDADARQQAQAARAVAEALRSVAARRNEDGVESWLPLALSYAGRMLESLLSNTETARLFVECGGIDLLLKVHTLPKLTVRLDEDQRLVSTAQWPCLTVQKWELGTCTRMLLFSCVLMR